MSGSVPEAVDPHHRCVAESNSAPLVATTTEQASDKGAAPVDAPPPDDSSGGGGGVLRLDNTKAGMATVDKAYVEAVINDMSRGSPFYINEQRKAAARKKKAAAMALASAQFDAMPAPKRRSVHDAVARAVALLEAQRTFGVYVHLDMDMFFAAVEEKRNPSLKTVPFGVGGLGMLSTTNYLARAFGVRAGMPGYIGRKLCPQLVFAHSSYDAYRLESEAVRAILKEYDPCFHSGGLDEFTLNLRPYLEAAGGTTNGTTVDDPPEPAKNVLLLEGAARVAEEIRERIQALTQLTASCGIAATPCLAKIVGNFNKPNGQYLLREASREGVLAFVGSLPVRSIPGIGKAMEEVLNLAFGITTCAQLLDQRDRLYHCWTPKTFEFLLEVGLGVMGSFAGFPSSGNKEDEEDEEDHRIAGDGEAQQQQHRKRNQTSGTDPPEPPPAEVLRRKSIGHERTFRPKLLQQDLIDVAESNLLRSHATLVEEGLCARQVGLKLKYTSFEVKQSTATLSLPTDDIAVLHEAMMCLLTPHLHEHLEFRLLGVRLADLCARSNGDDGPQQPPQISMQHSGAVLRSVPPREGETPVKKRLPLHGGHKSLDAFFCRPAVHAQDAVQVVAGSTLLDDDDVVLLTTTPPSSRRIVTCISDDEDDDDGVVVESHRPHRVHPTPPMLSLQTGARRQPVFPRRRSEVGGDQRGGDDISSSAIVCSISSSSDAFDADEGSDTVLCIDPHAVHPGSSAAHAEGTLDAVHSAGSDCCNNGNQTPPSCGSPVIIS